MSWQDELQRLDSALAAGQISADEYRTRRDRVIAQASGQESGEAAQPAPSAEPTHVFRPVQPPQGPEGGDPTQFVSGNQGQGQDHPGDRTQVVSGNQDADSTQVVPGAAATHPPRFPPPQPLPPWETGHPQQPNMSQQPPWANEDLPPEFGSQSWPRQGPEIFEEQGGGNTGKVIAIVVAVVLVLGGAGAAIWFFALKDNGSSPQGGGNTSQTEGPKKTEEPPPPPDIPDGPFIELDGEDVLNRTVPMEQALTEKRPTEKEAQLLQSVGVSEVGMLVTDEDGLRRGIWAFKVGDGGDPAAVLTAMDQFYEQAKYELVSQENGVLVRKLAAPSPDKPTVYRAHFVVDGGYMVRVEVYGTDSANVESTFTDILTAETDEFPPVQ